MDVNERNCKLLSYWIPILVLAVTNRSYAGGRNLASARVSLIGLHKEIEGTGRETRDSHC
jgi:hypothetical protein